MINIHSEECQAFIEEITTTYEARKEDVIHMLGVENNTTQIGGVKPSINICREWAKHTPRPITSEIIANYKQAFLYFSQLKAR